MVRIITVLALIVISFSAYADKNDITIKGTVTNPLADKVIFTYISYEDNWLDYRENTVEKELDGKGNFTATFPVSHKYTLVRIHNGNQATEIYASPEDKLKMFVDGNNFDESIKYEGVGMKADVANYMAKHMLKYGFTQSIYMEMNDALDKEIPDYIAEIEKLTQRELDFLIEHGIGLPQSFVEFWNANYEYLKFEKMQSYPTLHEIALQQSYDIGTVPQENFAIVKRVPAKFNDKFLHVGHYKNYAESYYSQQLAAEEIKRDKSYFQTDKAMELARANMPKKTAEYVYAERINRGLQHVPMERTEMLYETFSERYDNSIYADYLVERINRKKLLAPGAPAIDFAVMDADGRKVKISDLKGKVVYIDFWASWCGPCKAEFPHTKKLKDHFRGKDVAFVYVSIDKNKDSWEKAIEKHELTGYHTREAEEKSAVVKDYGVRGVPTYFLIDRDGNFAAENTPRPSSGEELIKMIEALL